MRDGQRTHIRHELAVLEAICQQCGSIVREPTSLSNRSSSPLFLLANLIFFDLKSNRPVSHFDGLDDEPRCGAPRKIVDDKITEVVTKTRYRPMRRIGARARWRKASGVSVSTVHRIWAAFSLAPYRTDTFKLSTDPQFVEKVRDIVGLYLHPPEGA
jgi:hypothetical protein